MAEDKKDIQSEVIEINGKKWYYNKEDYKVIEKFYKEQEIKMREQCNKVFTKTTKQ